MVIIMGDFNANLVSNRFSKPPDYRSSYLMSFIDQNGLIAIDTLEICIMERGRRLYHMMAPMNP